MAEAAKPTVVVTYEWKPATATRWHTADTATAFLAALQAAGEHVHIRVGWKGTVPVATLRAQQPANYFRNFEALRRVAPFFTGRWQHAAGTAVTQNASDGLTDPNQLVQRIVEATAPTKGGEVKIDWSFCSENTSRLEAAWIKVKEAAKREAETAAKREAEETAAKRKAAKREAEEAAAKREAEETAAKRKAAKREAEEAAAKREAEEAAAKREAEETAVRWLEKHMKGVELFYVNGHVNGQADKGYKLLLQLGKFSDGFTKAYIHTTKDNCGDSSVWRTSETATTVCPVSRCVTFLTTHGEDCLYQRFPIVNTRDTLSNEQFAVAVDVCAKPFHLELYDNGKDYCWLNTALYILCCVYTQLNNMTLFESCFPSALDTTKELLTKCIETRVWENTLYATCFDILTTTNGGRLTELEDDIANARTDGKDTSKLENERMFVANAARLKKGATNDGNPVLMSFFGADLVRQRMLQSDSTFASMQKETSTPGKRSGILAFQVATKKVAKDKHPECASHYVCYVRVDTNSYIYFDAMKDDKDLTTTFYSFEQILARQTLHDKLTPCNVVYAPEDHFDEFAPPSKQPTVAAHTDAAGTGSDSASVPASPARTLDTIVSDTDLHSSTAFADIGSFAEGEVCAIRRSSGPFKYGRVQSVVAADNSVVVVVDAKSSTKTLTAAQFTNSDQLRKLQPQPMGPASRRRRVPTTETEMKGRYDQEKQQQLAFCRTYYPPTGDSVKVGDWTFNLSNVIQRKHDKLPLNPERLFIILYATDSSKAATNNVTRCHLLYRSRSDGSWRVTPYVNFRGQFSKGGNRHYTQETKPHLTISQEAEARRRAAAKNRTIQLITEEEYDKLLEKCSVSYQSYADELFTKAVTEVAAHRTLLNDLQNCKPGHCFMEKTIPEIKKDLQAANACCKSKALNGFVPAFVQENLIQRYTFDHTMLLTDRDDKGNPTRNGHTVVVEVYGAMLDTTPIEWHVAIANDRIWIDRIVYARAPTCEYGVYAQFIDSGILTNKPLEYASQCTKFIANMFRETVPADEIYHVEFNDDYVDITPFINKLDPICEFRKARDMPKHKHASVMHIEERRDFTLQSKDIGKYSIDDTFANSNLTGTVVALHPDDLPNAFATDICLPISLRNTEMVPLDSTTLYAGVWYAVYEDQGQVSGWCPFQVNTESTLTEPLGITTRIRSTFNEELLGKDCNMNELHTEVESLDDVIDGFKYGVRRSDGSFRYAKVAPEQTDTDEEVKFVVDTKQSYETYSKALVKGNIIKFYQTFSLMITRTSELLRRKTPGRVQLANVRVINDRGDNLHRTSPSEPLSPGGHGRRRQRRHRPTSRRAVRRRVAATARKGRRRTSKAAYGLM
jgi:hypothetical protein